MGGNSVHDRLSLLKYLCYLLSGIEGFERHILCFPMMLLHSYFRNFVKINYLNFAL